jgi:8-oxo-dGTP pyrophosphatase MutT (NUDIX family)
MSEPQAIAAATVIVMREGGSAPELLMVERAATLRFAGGATVFPGGRVDPGDLALAGGDDEVAARIAAIRETIEEAGVAVGIDLAAERLTTVWQALLRGEPLGSLIDLQALQPETLVPFARWMPRDATRIFDTRFYLARAPQGARPQADHGENVHAFWATAADLLAASERGEVTLIFPTRRNLERLACFSSFEAAVADAAGHPVRTITPWIERRDGVEHLCIPDDLGYPITTEPLTRVRRG